MKVPTANVIVGFDKDAMLKFFEAGATYKNLVKGITSSNILQKNILLFESEANPNFISFEHTQGFGKGMEMKLTLLDPKGEFEKRFLSDNIVRNIAGFNSDKEIARKSIYEQTVKQEDNVSTKKVISKAKRDTITSQKLYDAKFFSDAQKALEEHYGERHLYVAYGSGDNLAFWSGPHKVVLTNADITVKGSRKITLTLTPTTNSVKLSDRRGAYNEEVNLNLAGLTLRYSGISKPIDFQKLSQNISAYDPLSHLNLETLAVDIINGTVDTIFNNRADNQEALQKLGLDLVSSTVKNFDLHFLIVDTLRSYIQKATNNPNVIVLLPNINIICRKWLDASVKNSLFSSLGKAALKKGLGVGSLTKDSVLHVFDSNLGQLGLYENFISTFLSSFGLELHQVLRDYAKSSSSMKAIPSHVISAQQHYERSRSADERFKEYFKVHDFYAILQKADNVGIPDHMSVLRNVIKLINQHAKEDYQIQLGFYNETDIKLLDFWGGSSPTLSTHKFPLFGGYNTFSAEKEAIIFGDQALIQNYLYGKINLDKQFKSIQQFQDDAALAKSNQNKYELASENKKTSWDLQEQVTEQDLSDQEELDLMAVQQAANYEDSISNSIKAIPLHPLDALILTNKKYNKTIKSLLAPKRLGVGGFGKISDIPDDFGYSDKAFSTEEKQYIQDQEIPIFKYNTENPNILDMSFKFGGAYFAALKVGFSKMVTRRASGVAEGILPIGTGSFPIRTVGAAVAYLRQKNFSLGIDDRESLITELKDKAASPLVAANAVAALLDTVERGDTDDLRGLIQIDQLLPGNPQAVMTDLMEDVYRKALQMTIKTLPTFHISNIHDLTSPCIVFAQDAHIEQTRPPTKTLLNSFFSGLYKIMGFRHTINSTTAISEFDIVKNAPKYEDSNKEDDKETFEL